MEIIEHLDNPEKFINKCAVAAKVQVIFTVPNNRLGPNKSPCHVRKYTKEEIREILSNSYNFKKVNITAPGGNIICQCVK